MLAIASALEEVLKRRESRTTDCSGSSSPDAAMLLAREILACAPEGLKRLSAALRAGLEDASRRIDRVSVAVTGLAWLGSGVPSVEQEMIALVRNARREIMLCAYAITSSAVPFLAHIAEVVGQGVVATIALNGFSRHPSQVQTHLKNLARQYPERWHLRDFDPGINETELHAKVLVVDRSAALVGSANLSFHGMSVNHEMAVVVRGPAAESVAARIDLLLKATQPVPVD